MTTRTVQDSAGFDVHQRTRDCPKCGEPVAWENVLRPMKPDRVARAHELHARTCTAKAPSP